MFCPAGCSRGRSGGASSAALRPACACDRAGQISGRSLAVPLPRMKRSVGAGVSTRRSGRSGPARSGEIGLRPLGGLDHPPPRQAKILDLAPGIARTPILSKTSGLAGGGSSIRRCRGWPFAPAPAGPGRAIRAGVSRPRLHADREGPRRGSPCPVAGTGACGLGRGGARARIRPPAGPASKRPPRSGRRNAAQATREQPFGKESEASPSETKRPRPAATAPSRRARRRGRRGAPPAEAAPARRRSGSARARGRATRAVRPLPGPPRPPRRRTHAPSSRAPP